MSKSSLTAAEQLTNPKFMQVVQDQLLVRYFLRLKSSGNQDMSVEIVGGIRSRDERVPVLESCFQVKGSFTLATSFSKFSPCFLATHFSKAYPGLEHIVRRWEEPLATFPHRSRYLQARPFVGLVETESGTHEVGAEHQLFQICHGFVLAYAHRFAQTQVVQTGDCREDQRAAEVLVQRFSAFAGKQQIIGAARTFGSVAK